MLKPEKMAEPRVISLSTTVPLNDGNRIPTLGLGVFLSKNDGEAEQACLWALQHGYRHIDTAKFYASVQLLLTLA